MIAGIGTDIVESARVSQALARRGERFARKILAISEMAEFIASNAPDRLLAKRFAAKEAFAKALGTGIRGAITLPRLAVTHDPLGKPCFLVDPAVQAELDRRHISRIHLSLSDERTFVCAFVVMESDQ